MAVQVRADLTPAEFDLVRRALASYEDGQQLVAKAPYDRELGDQFEQGRAKREALSEAAQASDLLAKLNGNR